MKNYLKILVFTLFSFFAAAQRPEIKTKNVNSFPNYIPKTADALVSLSEKKGMYFNFVAGKWQAYGIKTLANTQSVANTGEETYTGGIKVDYHNVFYRNPITQQLEIWNYSNNRFEPILIGTKENIYNTDGVLTSARGINCDNFDFSIYNGGLFSVNSQAIENVGASFSYYKDNFTPIFQYSPNEEALRLYDNQVRNGDKVIGKIWRAQDDNGQGFWSDENGGGSGNGNIYNTDGALITNRVVDMKQNSIIFKNGDIFEIQANDFKLLNLGSQSSYTIVSTPNLIKLENDVIQLKSANIERVLVDANGITLRDNNVITAQPITNYVWTATNDLGAGEWKSPTTQTLSYTPNIGDTKNSYKQTDGNGWILINGRNKNTLTPTQITAFNSVFGTGVNTLPDTRGLLIRNAGATIATGSISGTLSNSFSLINSNIPQMPVIGTAFTNTSAYQGGTGTTGSLSGLGISNNGLSTSQSWITNTNGLFVGNTSVLPVQTTSNYQPNVQLNHFIYLGN